MHWTVVGRAASMGKGRPGSVSTEREWRRTNLDTSSPNRPNPNVAREPGRKKEMHTTTNTTTQQGVKKETNKRQEKQKEGSYLLPLFARNSI